MPALDPKIIHAYNQTRGNADKSAICHAPFTNINFEQTGKATACCYNRTNVLGTYPQNTLREMWFGEQAELLRDHMRKYMLEEGCQNCKMQLESGNYAGNKAKLYDVYAPDTSHKARSFFKNLIGSNKSEMPRVIEFELENTCNLECIMCNGDFSSSIRKNREKRAPMVSPYDKEFVKQLTEFMPHLTDMKFLGGEPFMIDIYHDIWEQVAAINPKIMIHITTNATLLNSRTKLLLEDMTAGINISIDSVVKETYEAVRIGASYEKVMDNIGWIIDYTRRKNTYAGLAICPMIINRYEIPGMVEFANERNMGVYFNTVYWPESQSLRFMSYKDLDALVSFYEANMPGKGSRREKTNYDLFNGYVNQVRFWKEELIQSLADDPPLLYTAGGKEKPGAAEVKGRSGIAQDIIHAMIINGVPKTKQYLPVSSEMHQVSVADIDGYLLKKTEDNPTEMVLYAYIESMDWLASSYLSAREYEAVQSKFKYITGILEGAQNKKQALDDLLSLDMLQNIHNIARTNVEQIEQTIKSRYY